MRFGRKDTIPHDDEDFRCRQPAFVGIRCEIKKRQGLRLVAFYQGSTEVLVAPAKAGVQLVDFPGFALSWVGFRGSAE